MAKVIAIKPLGKQSCWNLHVDHPKHNYVLANGIVSKNSHAWAYSIISYQEAWLKTYYPAEFMAALMSCEDDLDKISTYIGECKALGVEVRGPSINHSEKDFTFTKKGAIVFGFNSIKGLGSAALKAILEARKFGPFKSFENFMERIDGRRLNSKAVESLIYSGTFDEMNYGRQSLLESLPKIVEYFSSLNSYKERLLECEQRNTAVAQALVTLEGIEKGLSLIPMKQKDKKTQDPLDQEKFDSLRKQKMELRRIKPLKSPEQPALEKVGTMTSSMPISLEVLTKEKEILGYYVSIHPTDFVTGHSDTLHINEIIPGGRGVCNGVILNIKEWKSKSGKMAFLSVEDATAQAEVTVFASLWKNIVPLQIGDILRIMYRADNIDITPIKLIAEKARKIQLGTQNEQN